MEKDSNQDLRGIKEQIDLMNERAIQIDNPWILPKPEEWVDFFEKNRNKPKVYLVTENEAFEVTGYRSGSGLTVEPEIKGQYFTVKVPGINLKPQFYMREEGNVDQLFGELINIRGIHAQLGMNESTVRALRKKFNDGTPISVEKKREILEAAGYKMKQEERWGR